MVVVVVAVFVEVAMLVNVVVDALALVVLGTEVFSAVDTEVVVTVSKVVL